MPKKRRRRLKLIPARTRKYMTNNALLTIFFIAVALIIIILSWDSIKKTYMGNGSKSSKRSGRKISGRMMNGGGVNPWDLDNSPDSNYSYRDKINCFPLDGNGKITPYDYQYIKNDSMDLSQIPQPRVQGQYSPYLGIQ